MQRTREEENVTSKFEMCGNNWTGSWDRLGRPLVEIGQPFGTPNVAITQRELEPHEGVR